MTETRYQRIAREQAERQVIGAAKRAKRDKEAAQAIRAQERAMKRARRANVEVSDFDHSMNG